MSLKALDLSYAHGDQTLFDGLSLTLPPAAAPASSAPTAPARRRCCGSSAASSTPARGSVSLGPGDRIGYLPQEPPGPELTLGGCSGPPRPRGRSTRRGAGWTSCTCRSTRRWAR